MSRLKIKSGGLANSANGTIYFVNEFKFKDIKRFYHIYLPKKNLIRAFHGHFLESKYIYVTSGKLLVCAVKLTDLKNPSKKSRLFKKVLEGGKPAMLAIPPGYANGIKSLSKNTDVIFFSDSTLSKSIKDDYRFPYDYWGKEIWNID